MSSPAKGASNVDVLVVGAGPTGLMLGAALSEAGVSYRIVDKAAAPSDKSRALVVHAKTMELLQRLGVDQKIIARGQKSAKATVYINNEKALETEIGDIGLEDTPFSYVLFVSQAETERVLHEAFTARGGVVERGVLAKKIEIDANGVDVTLSHAKDGREENVRARYAVGCDGAHSVVRHAAPFKFDGEPYEQDFVLADILVDPPDEDGRIHFSFHDDGLVVLLPLGSEGLHRVIAMWADAPKNEGDPTLEEVQKMVDRFTPLRVKLHDPRWLARFRLHHRQADTYRIERLFLAGDAAHIHSPAGGQGMNTGIQDAANLGWKLALVLKHGAREDLLDTYDEERHPVGAQLLRTTDRLFSANTTRMQAVIFLRNFVVRRIAPLVLKTKSRGLAFRFLSELDIAYPKSSIVIENGRLSNDLRAGKRAPDAPLGTGTVFEKTAALAHHLLVFAHDDDHAARSFAEKMALTHAFLTPVIIPNDAEIARERYGIEHRGIVIIRPDGYVGLRSPGYDEKQVEAYVRRIFG